MCLVLATLVLLFSSLADFLFFSEPEIGKKALGRQA